MTVEITRLELAPSEPRREVTRTKEADAACRMLVIALLERHDRAGGASVGNPGHRSSAPSRTADVSRRHQPHLMPIVTHDATKMVHQQASVATTQGAMPEANLVTLSRCPRRCMTTCHQPHCSCSSPSRSRKPRPSSERSFPSGCPRQPTLLVGAGHPIKLCHTGR
jgi:hypothetical protein